MIDSYAHYSSKSFHNSFRYLTRNAGGYAIAEGERDSLFADMAAAGIMCSIEAGVSLERNEEVLQLCRQYPDRVFPSIGIHPNKAVFEKWSGRKKLAAQATTPGVIAIGEIGLDYHRKREEQYRLRQFVWFWHQISLANKMKLPVILHVRDAHEDALRILKLHPAKYGGVVHCFNGTWQDAEQYLKLGYHIGLGGSILQLEERASVLWEAVRHIPLNRILIETDAPYILPYCKDVIPPKLLRRARNTSMILPELIKKIAELKGTSAEEVETMTTENTVRLFRLPV